MELFEELERVKLRFVSAYQQLLDRDEITEEEFEDILQTLDRIDEYSQEELRERLGRFRNLSGV